MTHPTGGKFLLIFLTTPPPLYVCVCVCARVCGGVCVCVLSAILLGFRWKEQSKERRHSLITYSDHMPRPENCRSLTRRPISAVVCRRDTRMPTSLDLTPLLILDPWLTNTSPDIICEQAITIVNLQRPGRGWMGYRWVALSRVRVAHSELVVTKAGYCWLGLHGVFGYRDSVAYKTPVNAICRTREISRKKKARFTDLDWTVMATCTGN